MRWRNRERERGGASAPLGKHLKTRDCAYVDPLQRQLPVARGGMLRMFIVRGWGSFPGKSGRMARVLLVQA
eukprot:496440-Pyramimonas_sp.AAC.1